MSGGLQRSKILIVDECWIWMGSLNDSGYGPHRKWYFTLVGPIPSDLELDHLCLNRCCVNPSHLKIVTTSQNLKRRHELQCKKGHPRNNKNTYWWDGKRHCKDCRRKAELKYKERIKNG